MQGAIILFWKKVCSVYIGQRYKLFPGSALHIHLCLLNQHQEVHWKNIQRIKLPHHYLEALMLTCRTWQNFSDICGNLAAFHLFVSDGNYISDWTFKAACNGLCSLNCTCSSLLFTAAGAECTFTQCRTWKTARSATSLQTSGAERNWWWNALNVEKEATSKKTFVIYDEHFSTFLCVMIALGWLMHANLHASMQESINPRSAKLLTMVNWSSTDQLKTAWMAIHVNWLQAATFLNNKMGRCMTYSGMIIIMIIIIINHIHKALVKM